MAIARDAFTDRQGATGASSLTYAHTCTGTDLYLLVNVRIDNTGSDVVTGVTYNAVAMTRILFKATDSGGRGIYQYYLINPSTGSNNVVVSTSGTNDIYAYTASYTGVKQSSQPDASKTDEATGATSLTTSLTTVADNAWTTAFVRFDTNNVTSGTNYTVLGAADSFRYGDSNAAITPAGATTITANGAGGSGEWDAIYSSMSPATASGPANLKSLDTNVKANIKSYNTNVIANVKSINTNA